VPEIRRNLVTGEWVVVAPERARRPNASGPTSPPQVRPAHLADCPFCPGSEGSTPGTTLSFPEGEWRVRAFPNRFSLLAPTGEAWQRTEGPRQAIAAVGPHEVICEARRHDLSLGRLPPGEVADVVRAWHARFLAFSADPRVAFVSLFKNHGTAAGASLDHSHSQIVGLPMVPATVAARAAAAERHHAATGRCPCCQTLEDELRDGGRLVRATERFVAFIPWAALSPYHLWIFPRRHQASFAAASAEELAELGGLLHAVLRAVDLALDDAAYNLVVQSSPLDRAGSPALHWYLSVVPRVTRAAGFELGTAMYVNPSLPEDCALRLRQADS
jgi:UDPglucose--hexose-1-phosphate uridylyltransferase